MTHDLLRNVIEVLGASVKEVVIAELREGTFYAKIVFEYSDLEVDARPSDAIALAVRCNAPLYIDEAIMDEVALRAEDVQEVDDDETREDTDPSAQSTPVEREAPSQPMTERQRLEQELDQAIKVEDYEAAARIRDELQQLDR
jgi:bifunctional DNase/RNase